MKKTTILGLFILISHGVCAQITIPSTTLPDPGDVLEYATFNNFTDTSSYKWQGENLQWDYDTFDIIGSVEESYLDINQTDLADSFPDANMVVSIFGFQSAAIRTDSSIEVIGLETGDFSGFGIEAQARFGDPYLLRLTPQNYLDQLSDDFEVVVQFPSSLIPGLDTIPIPIPGTTLDSIRATITVTRTEHTTAWGNMKILGESIDVLKVEQRDSTSTKVEAGLRSIVGIFWVDVTPLLGGFGVNVDRMTYKFLSADSKASIVEFNENTIQDTLVLASGRISSELISSITSRKPSLDLFTLYPNPSDDVIYLSWKNNNILTHQLLLLDVDGRLVNTISPTQTTSGIDISGLAPGTYFIMANTSEGYGIRKFIKSN